MTGITTKYKCKDLFIKIEYYDDNNALNKKTFDKDKCVFVVDLQDVIPEWKGRILYDPLNNKIAFEAKPNEDSSRIINFKGALDDDKNITSESDFENLLKENQDLKKNINELVSFLDDCSKNSELKTAYRHDYLKQNRFHSNL